jgi:hypothetical protein
VGVQLPQQSVAAEVAELVGGRLGDPGYPQAYSRVPRSDPVRTARADRAI